MEYRYKLDKSSKKFNCPNCSKRRFVRYLDIESGQYCTEEFGRCDREVKCGYHKSPEGEATFVKTKEQPFVPPYEIPFNDFRKTLGHFNQNNLYFFMKEIFGEIKTKGVFQLYRVGTSKCWNGATLLWQINYYGKVGQGKIMVFDKETGKRIKKPFPFITSVHAQLGMQDRKPNYCLFGEHLIKHYPLKPIAVVESEKTALIMTIIEPNYLWIASGGLSQLNGNRLKYLKSNKLVFYPDLGAFKAWNDKAIVLNKNGFSIKVSTLLDKKASIEDEKMGFDIGDYYLSAHFNKENPTEKLNNLISTYPLLKNLVDGLGLVPYE